MLSVKSLHTDYAAAGGAVVNAVQDVSFDVPDGELFTLLGPSGCGKTTTLRSIAGLERPRSGSIALDGRVVYSSDQGIFVAPNRRNFGMVFQSYAIWPHMNVFKNVAFPLEVRKARPSRKEIEQKVMRVLATVQLAELVDRGGHRPVDGLLAGDVRGDDKGLAAHRRDRRRGLGQPVFAPGDERDIRAGFGQRHGDGPADPPGRAGDKRALSGQVEEVHGQSFHSVGRGQAPGLTRRTISFSTIRT